LVIGLVLGAILLAFAVKFGDKMLYGVQAFDPILLAAITAVLAITALISASLPAIRAASLDPVKALRAE
jgi:ABC-type antimicrobial peptide transport system permease subunit